MVECTALEMRRALTGTVGSNPTLSATSCYRHTSFTYAPTRYRAGVDSFLVSLDAQRVSYAAEQQLVTTRLNSASNLVELYRSLGGGIN